ncbi:hypothetical protein MAPG_00503 [Magnaporthiopsis poae ATCC 64411]|uniref:Myb-like domain-containing protein n=1 Tax=Magnaporthiopsis poae (strain ATCC 64411 / 73-15) TaxID=644358 RepID=A0A0C4DL64_MAGP6|nr:hypothetical protein MAPG_00503 [Magnaporthiopsis poae ATCC 64411]
MKSTIGRPGSASRRSRLAESSDLGDNAHNNDGGPDDWSDADPEAPHRGRGSGNRKSLIRNIDDELQDSGPGYSTGKNSDIELKELSLSRPAIRRDSDGPLSSPSGSAYSPGPGDSDASSAGSNRQNSRQGSRGAQADSDGEKKRTSKRRSPLKRSRSEAARSQDPDDTPRPFKRIKGNINRQYVALLNADIEDARDRHVPHPWPELPSSQFGLTFWTPEEKHSFFEALARLGRHKPDLIAARLETKSEMEVRQYIDLLERAKRERRKGGQLDPIQKRQVPAAVELGQECVAALEQAADSLSLHQEAHEEAAARSRQRRDGHLLLTADNCRELVEEAKLDAAPHSTHHLNPLAFFNAPHWLELSERLFMNASFEEMNWQSVSHEPPSIRLVALDDFYAIVRAVTRKLVCEAVFNARTCSRGRSRTAVSKGHISVRAKHVPSPEQIVGKPELAGRELFFAGCARRLHLEVVDDQDEEGPHGADYDMPESIMSYEDVESALSSRLRKKHAASAAENNFERRDTSPMSSINEPSDGDDHGDAISSQNSVNARGGEGTEFPVADNDVTDSDSVSTISLVDSDVGVEEEVDEVVVYSAFGIMGTTKDKNALRLRVRGEREREDLAEAVDCRASYVEERRLWAEVLGCAPTVPPMRVPKPDLKAGSAAVAVRRKLAVEDIVEELA